MLCWCKNLITYLKKKSFWLQTYIFGVTFFHSSFGEKHSNHFNLQQTSLLLSIGTIMPQFDPTLTYPESTCGPLWWMLKLIVIHIIFKLNSTTWRDFSRQRMHSPHGQQGNRVLSKKAASTPQGQTQPNAHTIKRCGLECVYGWFSRWGREKSLC